MEDTNQFLLTMLPWALTLLLAMHLVWGALTVILWGFWRKVFLAGFIGAIVYFGQLPDFSFNF
ncbi:MAG: hypothetical protein QNL04_11005 [SAR324 cluster bacterium]|nr:hypothetical protein [SAR324 cluster bacterium]